METLFQTHQTSNVPIILVDASGSVKTLFHDVTIFDKMKNIVIGLREERVRLIFWNSSEPEKTFFRGGIYRIPFVVNRDTLNHTFRHIHTNIGNGCLTMPHIAFENIPNEWINDKDMTRIYFITDGQICCHNEEREKNDLADSIKRLFDRHNNIQLNIITVESRNVDLTSAETTRTSAGTDVYEIIMNRGMTRYITKFISYTLNNEHDGFVHINKNIPPAGFVPYRENYFSVLKVGEFIRFIMDEITRATDDDKLLQIIQNLSSTIAVLIKDKQKNIAEGTINTFCQLFRHTNIDPLFVRMILTESIQRETAGSALIYSTYRTQLKDLYKRADTLLLDNVRDAINVGNRFITFPYNDKIVIGNYRMIDRNIIHQNKIYHNGAIEINKKIIPILPYTFTDSQLSNQCIRQWTRTIMNKLHHINAYDDSIMYVVLGHILQVVLSDVDDDIKNAYRRLGTTMLRKKRLLNDITELERLQTGGLPMDNKGIVESFYTFMNIVCDKMKITMNPFVLWYAMCLALNDEYLITRQLIHCAEHITKEFGDIEPRNLLRVIKERNIFKSITIHRIRDEALFDYVCLITMEDTAKTGGYRFLPHTSASGVICCPQNVLSEIGYNQLISRAETCICPICYERLNVTNFERVGAKPDEDATIIFSEDVKNVFGEDVHQIEPIQVIQLPLPLPSSIQTASASTTSSVLPQSTQTLPITVVVMRGTVGSGKSHFSRLLKEHIEKNDGLCIVEGTDQYCKTGISVDNAIRTVTSHINEFANVSTDKRKFIIIDTCGERNNTKQIFGVTMCRPRWRVVTYFPNYIKDKMKGYMQWSLRNVLRRKQPDSNSSFYLNPIGAGVLTCVKVHMRKAQALFSNRAKDTTPLIYQESIDVAIRQLNDEADIYERALETELPIEREVERFYSAL